MSPYRALAVPARTGSWLDRWKCRRGNHAWIETGLCHECRGAYLRCARCDTPAFRKRPGCLLHILGGCTQSHPR